MLWCAIHLDINVHRIFIHSHPTRPRHMINAWCNNNENEFTTSSTCWPDVVNWGTIKTRYKFKSLWWRVQYNNSIITMLQYSIQSQNSQCCNSRVHCLCFFCPLLQQHVEDVADEWVVSRLVLFLGLLSYFVLRFSNLLWSVYEFRGMVDFQWVYSSCVGDDSKKWNDGSCWQFQR